eukprot:gene6097-7596_t
MSTYKNKKIKANKEVPIPYNDDSDSEIEEHESIEEFSIKDCQDERGRPTNIISFEQKPGIQHFLACIFILGKVQLPHIRSAWESGPYYFYSVSHIMSSDQFEFLLSNLHFANNLQKSSDNQYWKLVSESGYLGTFELYHGKDSSAKVDEGKVGESVVQNLLSQIHLESDNHIIFMDNYFSTIPLFEELEKKKYPLYRNYPKVKNRYPQ